jgi:S1-C subfamily serine protease
MSKPTPDERVAVFTWQDWIARVMPMLYVTMLTIALPTILSPSWLVSDLAATQEQKLHKHLRSISVKILAHGKTIGSGAILAVTTQPLVAEPSSLAVKQQVYTVVTNAHVIQAASAPFQLQTHDGQIYAAALIPPPTDQNRDLSILRFQSNQRIYTTAKLATAEPKIGDRIWSAGFPLVDGGSAQITAPIATDKTASGLNIVKGQITQILPIAMTGGYSIGSDRTIFKGMSGGPLIDQAGELVGIDGVHANPLWDTPEVLEDGSTVSEALQEQIKNSSWAIPIEFVRDYARL